MSPNVKLASVARDVFGVSGMAMLEALVAGTMTPAEIANFARGRLRKKLARLELPCTSASATITASLVDRLLRSLEQEEDRITATADRITAQLEPYREEHRLLTTTPGVDWAVAATMIAEHGIDMTRFGTAALGRLVQRRSR